MTELQVKAAQLAEDKRHNLATEKLTKDLNAAQAEHLSRSDEYTASHYERSDTAGLISANASAMNAKSNYMNAETNRKNYEMQHDIEYGWTGSEGYPSGMPLSAQQKNADIQKTIEITKAQLEDYAANALYKKSSAVSNILNSVFGKGGIINTVSDIIGPSGTTVYGVTEPGTQLIVSE